MSDPELTLSGEITLDTSEFAGQLNKLKTDIETFRQRLENNFSVKLDKKGLAEYRQEIKRINALSAEIRNINKSIYSLMSSGKTSRDKEIVDLNRRKKALEDLRRLSQQNAKEYEAAIQTSNQLRQKQIELQIVQEKQEKKLAQAAAQQAAIEQKKLEMERKAIEAQTLEEINNRRKLLTSLAMGIPGATPLGMGYMVGGISGLAGAGIAMGGGALVGIAAAAIKFASQMERAQIAFASVLKSASEARIMMKDIVEFAQATPFDTEEVINLAQYMVGLGFDAREVIPLLTAVGDAVSALGGGTDKVEAVVRALGQMRQKSRVSAQEMNQLAEAGIDGWNMLAESLGVTVPKAMQMAEQKMISAEQGISAIINGMATKYSGAMARMMNTSAGATEQLKDSWKSAMYDMGSYITPMFKELLAELRVLGKTSKPVTDALAGLGTAIATVLTLLLKLLNLILLLLNAVLRRISNLLIEIINFIIAIANGIKWLSNLGKKISEQSTYISYLEPVKLFPDISNNNIDKTLNKYREGLKNLKISAKESAEEIRKLNEAIIEKTKSMREDIATMQMSTEYEKAKYDVSKEGEFGKASKELKEEYLKTAKMLDVAKANKEVDENIKSLTKDIKLFGNESKYAALKFEIFTSNLRFADTKKIEQLLKLAKQLDKLESDKKAREEAKRKQEETKKKQLSMAIEMQRDYVEKLKSLANDYINALQEETNSVINILKERFEEEQRLEEKAINDKKSRYEKLKSVGRALVGAMTDIRMFDKEKPKEEFDPSKVTRADIISASRKYREDLAKTNALKARVDRTLHGNTIEQLQAVTQMDSVAKYEEEQANLLKLLVDISNRQYQVLKSLISPRVTGAGVVA